MSDKAEDADWPLRPWLLAGLLAVAGLLVDLASDGGEAQTVPWRMALAALFVFGPIAAAFTLERNRDVEPGIFAALVGLVMAGIAWRATSAGDHYPDAQFWVGAGVISVALALPLFQAGFHRRRFALPYPEVHAHAWNDALSGVGALAFTGVSWVVLAILNKLFQLVGIHLIDTLIDESWFAWMFSGAAFGAALGTLRNQLKILGTLQSVAMLVLSLLAVPLALALLVFLVALVATGGQALWNATDSATPVLLACAVGAFGLGNAILRDADAEMSGNRVLRIAALVLCLAILPLTVFAAISMGARIDQHGLSPERLWGLIAVAVACAFGLAYLVAVIRGRGAGWRERVRRANLHLAVLVCAVALILALPIFDFGAISARNQVARLEASGGRVDQFDFDALRWDFGDGGRKALARLAKSDNAIIASRAKGALARTQRYQVTPIGGPEEDQLKRNLVVLPDDPELRDALDEYARRSHDCVYARCIGTTIGSYPDGSDHLVLIQGSNVIHLHLEEDGRVSAGLPPKIEVRPAPTPTGSTNAQPTVEVRPYSGKQIYLNGEPVGEPFE